MNNIKKFRGLLGISQQELGEKVGLTKASICLLERPECHSITEANAIKISKVLNCSVIELYGMDNLKFRPKDDTQKIQLIKIIYDAIENDEIRNNLMKELVGEKYEDI